MLFKIFCIKDGWFLWWAVENLKRKLEEVLKNSVSLGMVSLFFIKNNQFFWKRRDFIRWKFLIIHIRMFPDCRDNLKNLYWMFPLLLLSWSYFVCVFIASLSIFFPISFILKVLNFFHLHQHCLRRILSHFFILWWVIHLCMVVLNMLLLIWFGFWFLVLL